MSDKKPAFNKKRVIRVVFGVVGLLVLAGGFGALVWLLQNNISQPSNPPKPVELQTQDLRLEGRYDEASKKINEELDKPSTSSDDKYALYIQYGSLMEDQNKTKEATESYLKAAAIKETQDVYMLLGDAYRKLGDKDKAISAYKKAISLIAPNNPVAGEDKTNLEQRITNLGGQP